MTKYEYLVSFSPFIFFSCAIISAIMSDGYRKAKEPNQKMSQLYSWISILCIVIAFLTGGAYK